MASRCLMPHEAPRLFLWLLFLLEQSHHAVDWILLLLLLACSARLLPRKYVLKQARRNAFDVRSEFRVRGRPVDAERNRHSLYVRLHFESQFIRGADRAQPGQNSNGGNG